MTNFLAFIAIENFDNIILLLMYFAKNIFISYFKHLLIKQLIIFMLYITSYYINGNFNTAYFPVNGNEFGHSVLREPLHPFHLKTQVFRMQHSRSNTLSYVP